MRTPIRYFPRKSSLADSVSAHFGISQAKMALLLELTEGVYEQVAGGRRPLTTRQIQRLLPLAQVAHSQATTHPLPPLPTWEPPAKLAPELEHLKRLHLHFRRCDLRAMRLRDQLHKEACRTVFDARWAAAKPVVLTQEPFVSDEEARRWVESVRPHVRPADELANHLLAAKLAGLEAEAAALLAVVRAATPPPPS